MSYLLKRVSKKNLKDISILYKDCFGINVEEEKLRKKYNTSVFGESYTGFVAENKEKQIGAYYGVFPSVINCDGQEYLVGQSGDTMTGPNHRRKGLFTKLAKETYQLCEELNMAFVFGFPNENSLPGFERKLDWKFYGNMQMFTFYHSTLFPFCELASKFSSFQPFYRSFVAKRISNYVIDVNDIKLQSKNSVVRDERFFSYKMSNSNAVKVVHINGFKLVFKAEPHLMIGDVEVFDKKRVGDFIQTVHQLARIIKAKKSQIVVSENHWIYPILSIKVTPSPSLPIGFYEIDKNIKYSKISFSMLDYDTFI